MGVWARTSRPSAFVVRYGTRPDRLDRASAPVPTALDSDAAAWVLLEGLEPDTAYHYEVFALAGDGREVPGPTGTFRTLPEPEGFRHPELNPRGLFNFQFEVGSCANQGQHSVGPSLPAYATLNEQFRDDVAFAIMNGDFVYEDRRDFPVDGWLAEVGASADEVPTALRLAPAMAGVWENYKVYLSRSAPMAEWHRHVPSYFTADDHEILNDVYGCGEIGLRDRRAVFRDIGLKGWGDYVAWSNPTASSRPIHFGRARLEAGGDILTDPAADFRARLRSIGIGQPTHPLGHPDGRRRRRRAGRAGGRPERRGLRGRRGPGRPAPPNPPGGAGRRRGVVLDRPAVVLQLAGEQLRVLRAGHPVAPDPPRRGEPPTSRPDPARRRSAPLAEGGDGRQRRRFPVRRLVGAVHRSRTTTPEA